MIVLSFHPRLKEISKKSYNAFLPHTSGQSKTECTQVTPGTYFSRMLLRPPVIKTAQFFLHSLFQWFFISTVTRFFQMLHPTHLFTLRMSTPWAEIDKLINITTMAYNESYPRLPSRGLLLKQKLKFSISVTCLKAGLKDISTRDNQWFLWMSRDTVNFAR